MPVYRARVLLIRTGIYISSLTETTGVNNATNPTGTIYILCTTSLQSFDNIQLPKFNEIHHSCKITLFLSDVTYTNHKEMHT